MGEGHVFKKRFDNGVNVGLYCLVMFIPESRRFVITNALSSCEACLFGSTFAFTILSYSVNYNLLLFLFCCLSRPELDFYSNQCIFILYSLFFRIVPLAYHSITELVKISNPVHVTIQSDKL